MSDMEEKAKHAVTFVQMVILSKAMLQVAQAKTLEEAQKLATDSMVKVMRMDPDMTDKEKKGIEMVKKELSPFKKMLDDIVERGKHGPEP